MMPFVESPGQYLFVAQERWPHGEGSASDLAFRIGHVSFIKKGHVFMAGVERGLTAGTHTHTHTHKLAFARTETPMLPQQGEKR